MAICGAGCCKLIMGAAQRLQAAQGDNSQTLGAVWNGITIRRLEPQRQERGGGGGGGGGGGCRVLIKPPCET